VIKVKVAATDDRLKSGGAERSLRAAELRAAALAALALSDPVDKVRAVAMLAAAPPAVVAADRLTAPSGLPGRPSLPRLVAPAALAARGVGTPQGRAALLHALAHIEFNAINLALDAIWRYADLPDAYYTDWLRVAAEEAQHFELLVARLASLDAAYGDFDAHDGLWDMAAKTADDVLARMALVPRTLEARGLDASPAIRARLAASGDPASAAVLDIILRDEIGHVAIGNRWFAHLCAQRGLDTVTAYAELAARYRAPRLRGPFNLAARRAAGFDEREIAALGS
jgi:uncharacterized ferritin-like protein (DUF455 family)